MKFHWPKVFTKRRFKYSGSEVQQKAAALSDGLVGWGHCHARAPIPKGFGRGMIKIGQIVGCRPLQGDFLVHVNVTLAALKKEQADAALAHQEGES